MGAASRKNKGLVLPLGSWCGWEKAGGGGETQDGKCAWGALGGMRQCEDIVTGCNEGKSQGTAASWDTVLPTASSTLPPVGIASPTSEKHDSGGIQIFSFSNLVVMAIK